MGTPEILPSMPRTDFVERSPLTRDALAFARRSHAGQTRDLDSLPFVTHPVEVACLLHESGYPDEVVAAGVLHDVLEDTEVGPAELRERFGPQVARLVVAVSDDPTIADARERKAALRRQVAAAGEHAVAVFAADKVSKAREMRARHRRGLFEDRDRLKLEHYEASLALVADVLPEPGLADKLRDELRALHSHSV
jgi:(p)ppGpp synthase/HD superfamily hydrolase